MADTGAATYIKIVSPVFTLLLCFQSWYPYCQRHAQYRKISGWPEQSIPLEAGPSLSFSSTRWPQNLRWSGQKPCPPSPCRYQYHGNPIFFIHVVRRENALLLKKHVFEHPVVNFQVEYIHPLISWKSQLISPYLHHQGKPFLVVAVAEDRIVFIFSPGIFRGYFVFLFYVGKDFFAHDFYLLCARFWAGWWNGFRLSKALFADFISISFGLLSSASPADFH